MTESSAQIRYFLSYSLLWSTGRVIRCYILFLDHNAEFNNTETSQMPYTHRDLSHIASEIT